MTDYDGEFGALHLGIKNLHHPAKPIR